MTSIQLTSVVIPLLTILVLSIGLGNAYAHKADVVGDYKIEIGWDEEPPIQGIKNSIELVVTHATETDKEMAAEMDKTMDMANEDEHTDETDMAHEDHTDETDMAHEDDHDHEGGISGLAETMQVRVSLDGESTTLNLVESDLEGMYLGEFIPNSSGYPVVHLSGMIEDTEVDLDMHPEMVESLSILPPLKQLSLGIEPNEVQCKEGLNLFMRTNDGSAICASNELGERLISFGIVES